MPIEQNTPAARGLVNGFAGMVTKDDATAPTMVLSPRQIELDILWRHFRCSTYDGYKVHWDGTKATTDEEADHVATQSYTPEGFVDEGGDMPLRFRRPSSQYYLGRVIPLRFTSLLFGKKRCPKLLSDDPDTGDWLDGWAKAVSLWGRMKSARNFGGAMGSVGIGFKFVRGRPVFEVFDPRWAEPEFSDRQTMTLRRLVIQYQYPEWQRDPMDGTPYAVWYWYRRVIDANTDTVWRKVKVIINEEPDWANEPNVLVKHNLGEVPCEWIQNEPVDDDIDGDPDCHGCYDKIKVIDGLWSESTVGVQANCDPSTVIASDREFRNGIRMGHKEGIQVEKGGSVTNLETTGQSAKAAADLANTFEEHVLTMCRCILENSHGNIGGADRTATEINRNFSAMLDRADDFRQTYGDPLVRLLEKVLRAARRLTGVTIGRAADGTAEVQQQVIRLPKKKVVDTKDPSKVTFEERVLGNGDEVDLHWPDYFEPSLADVQLAVDAAGKAFKVYGIVDIEAALKFIAQYLRIEDIPSQIEKVRAMIEENKMLPALQSALGNDAASRSEIKSQKPAKMTLTG